MRTKQQTRWIVWFMVASLLCQGCNRRGFYRRQADAEAYCLIEQKLEPNCWPLGRHHIDVDPDSRMFDPFNLDCSPIPPDDPNSHRYMHCVYCKNGYACWHCNGNRRQVEGPHWANSLIYDDCNAVLLDEPKSIELALLHSPDYQTALESLYLSALNVSFERFQCDVQLFSGGDLFFTHSGPDRPGNGGNTSNTLGIGSSSQLSRRFATGAQLLIGLANQIMWDFSAPTVRSASTLLDFSIIQPLLRNGGRHIALENLTQAERTLLANIRQMERFRRQFYVDIMTGRGIDTRPLPGDVTLGSLSPRTNTTGGVGGYLGLLTAAQNIRNQRSNIAALQSSVTQLEAFFQAGRIDLFQVEFSRQALYAAQNRLLVSERTLRANEDVFKIALGLPPTLDLRLDDSLITPFQLVDPDIIPLQNDITRLQEQVGEATNAIISLATPQQRDVPPPPIESLPDPLSPADSSDESDDEAAEGTSSSNLLDRLLARAQESSERDANGRSTDVENPNAKIDSASPRMVYGIQDAGLEILELSWDGEIEQRLKQIQNLLGEARVILDQATAEHVPEARQDIDNLKAAIPDRTKSAERLKKRVRARLEWNRRDCESGESTPTDEDAERQQKKKAAEIDNDVEALLPFDEARLIELPQVLRATVADVERQIGLSKIELTRLNQAIDEILQEGESLESTELYTTLREKVFTAVPTELNNIAATVLSLTLVQARARTESVTFPLVDLEWQEAVEIARCHRLDWMNARAALVDSWRAIEITANALEAELDVVIDGDVQNLGNHAFDFRPSTGQIRGGFRFDAPLTRLDERNVYRASQIAYQRSRRQYYQFEDNVTASLRDILRRMEINAINFELNRAGVDVAISQVELSRFRLQEPPKPGAAATFSPTTARDLVSALANLLNVQNDFLGVWSSQEVLRRSLDLDLGTMQLDGVGLWLDPGELVGRQGCIINEIVDESGGAIVLPDPNNQQLERIPPTEVDLPTLLEKDAPAREPRKLPSDAPAA